MLPDEGPPPVLPNEPSPSPSPSPTPLAAPTAAHAVVQQGGGDQRESSGEGELPSGSATAAPAAAQAAVQSTASTSRHALRGVAAAQQQRQPTPAATPGSAAPKPRPTPREQPLARPPWEVAHILWQVSNTPHATQMHVPHASVDRLRGPHRPRGPKGVRQAQHRCVESQAWPYGPPAAWLATPSPYHTPSKSASAPSLSLRPSSVNTSRLYVGS